MRPLDDTLDRFIGALTEPDDIMEIRCKKPGGAVDRRWATAAEIPALEGWLADLNDAGSNIYVGANPRRAAGTGTLARTCTPDRPCGGCSSCVALARNLFVDIDGVTLEDGRRRIDEAALAKPTVLIDSGHGCQCWWRLEEPIVDLAVWVGHQRGLIAALDSDPKVCDLPRVMRLPGFVNVNPPPADAVLVDVDAGRIYPLEEFPEAAAPERLLRISCPSPGIGSARCGPEVEAAVLSTLPTGPGQRRRCLFALSQLLRGLDPSAAPEAWLWVVKDLWHPKAVAFIEHKDLEDSIADFLNGWPYMKKWGVSGPLDRAIRAAALRPPPPEAAQFIISRIARELLALGAELQRRAGRKAFYLDQTKVAERFGVTQPTISFWVRKIRAKGIWKRTGGGHTGRATEYRYLVGADPPTMTAPERP